MVQLVAYLLCPIVVFLLLESPSTSRNSAGKYHGFGISVTFMVVGMTKFISNDLNSIILAHLCKPVTVCVCVCLCFHALELIRINCPKLPVLQ